MVLLDKIQGFKEKGKKAVLAGLVTLPFFGSGCELTQEDKEILGLAALIGAPYADDARAGAALAGSGNALSRSAAAEAGKSEINVYNNSGGGNGQIGENRFFSQPEDSLENRNTYYPGEKIVFIAKLPEYKGKNIKSTIWKYDELGWERHSEDLDNVRIGISTHIVRNASPGIYKIEWETEEGKILGTDFAEVRGN